MEVIAAARIAAFKRALAMLSWRQRALEGMPVQTGPNAEVDNALAGYGLVVTPAQDLGFFARSAAWRCTSCGKVHSFDERVSVVFASPCACASIEFEPQRDENFSDTLPPEQTLPALLTQ
jgi:hypothetical protein